MQPGTVLRHKIRDDLDFWKNMLFKTDRRFLCATDPRFGEERPGLIHKKKRKKKTEQRQSKISEKDCCFPLPSSPLFLDVNLVDTVWVHAHELLHFSSCNSD